MKKYLQSYWYRSAAFSILQRFSLTLFGLVNFMILVRTLPIELMGTWALFLTIITLLETNKAALLRNAHIRFVTIASNDNEKAQIASSSMIVNLLISVVFILLILIFGGSLERLLNAEADFSLMLIAFIPGIVAMVFFSHFEAVQQSHLDFKGVFAGNLAKQVLFFVFLLLHVILKQPLSLWLLSVYQAISILVGSIVLYFHARKYLIMRFIPSLSWVKKLMNYGGYIFGSGVVSSIYSNLDQLMTATFIKGGAVAYYNTARRINGFIDIPTYSAAEIAFPKMSQASSLEGLTRIKFFYEKIVAILLSIIIPLGIVVILFPKLIIFLIAGSKYYPAAPILQAFIVVSVLGIVQHQAGTTLYSIGKSKLCFFLNCTSLAVNLLATYLCLRYFGFYGAAIAALISAVFTTILWYSTMKREIGFELSNLVRYSKEFYGSVFNKLRMFLKQKNKEATE